MLVWNVCFTNNRTYMGLNVMSDGALKQYNIRIIMTLFRRTVRVYRS